MPLNISGEHIEQLPTARKDFPSEGTDGLLEQVAAGLIAVGRFYLQLLSIFIGFAAAAIQIKGSQWKFVKNILTHQIIFSGVDAFFVVGSISAMVGGVLMIQLISFSSAFATDKMMMELLVSVIIRELAPLLTTLILIARSASAITIELGTMRLKHHDEILDSMGISIVKYFHMPRILGLTISNVALSFYFVLVTLASAMAISIFRENVSIESLLIDFVASLTLTDLLLCGIKSALLGLTIALVCIYHGLSVEKSSTELPQQTSAALVNSYLLCYKFNMIMSITYYLLA